MMHTLRTIVNDHQFKTVFKDELPGKPGEDSGLLLDVQTANAILTIWEAMHTENRVKLERMIQTPAGLLKVAEFAFAKLS